MPSYSEIFSNSWAMMLVLLFFGGSIFVHELGHFVAAKIRGLKVLRFSIGFGPRILSWTGKDGCKYMLSLLPLGGYVALPQLVDLGALEGEENEDELKKQKLPPASVTDKIIVSAAGAFFNVLFACILASIVWYVGIPENQSYKSTLVGYVNENLINADGTKIPSPAKIAKLQIGDKILTIDGKEVKDFISIVERIAIGSGRDEDNNPKATLKIERNGKELNVDVYPALVKTNIATGDAIRMIGVAPSTLMKVAKVMPNSPAEKSGVKSGDIVKKINSISLYSNQQLAEILNSIPPNKAITLTVFRNGKDVDINILPQKVTLTKSLCIVKTPDATTQLEFIFTPSKENPKKGTIKLFSYNKNNSALKDLRIGSTLYEIDGAEMHNLEAIENYINSPATQIRTKLSFIDNNYTMVDVYIPSKCGAIIEPPKTQIMLGYLLENVTVISHPNIFEQFQDSIKRTYNALSSLINPKSDIGISSLAGPVDIGRVIYQLSLSDITLVISFAVLLNINLAILNMMPIPVLDGGHIFFAILEKVRNKPLPPKFFAVIQGSFSILFISLMVYIVYIGFARWKGDADLQALEQTTSDYYIKDISFK